MKIASLFSIFTLLLVNAPAVEPVIDLSGRWQVVLDAADEGLERDWGKAPPRNANPIELPGSTDLAGLGPRRTEAGPHEYHLIRAHAHLGPAWYVREIEIPPDWKDRRIVLELERVMWQSRAWIGGIESGGAEDSLCVPHEHEFPPLAPGKHHLVIRVDNRMIHPIGDKGHAYGDQMQGRWNGIAGGIHLRALAQDAIRRVRIFPDAGAAEVKVEVSRRGIAMTGSWIILRDPEQQIVGEAALPNGADSGQVATIPLKEKPLPWSEFARPIYSCVITSAPNGEGETLWSGTFGFRSLGRTGQRITINGKPAFFRGNLECAAFPLTGYPPTDVGSWRAIWAVYREHNLNHARFHSWCPPKAAFIAADEAGIYLQVEAPIWMDGWMAQPNPRPEMDTEGYPKGLGKNDRTNDTFARAEIARILETYGNHPSFVFFCIGNELGTSDFNALGRWIKEAKESDPRRLYAASTARTITPWCDFNATHQIPGIGGARARTGIDMRWNYEETYRRAPVPIIAHETGQLPVHPLWKEKLDYTGPLKPFRLEALERSALAHGVHADDATFRAASGGLNRILNRDEIEGYLRTPSCSGFQLLSMQDFPGQGEALVGWRDIFYRDKGTTSAKEFRQWCAPIVPLLELPKRVFTTRESLQARVLLHHSGENDLASAGLAWELLDEEGKLSCGGVLERRPVAVGEVAVMGEISIDLENVSAGTSARIRLRGIGFEAINDYPIWIFAPATAVPVPEGVVETSDWTEAKEQLAKGARVVFLAHDAGTPESGGQAAWGPLYWSVPFFPGQSIRTLGLVVRQEHPIFKGFPSGAFGDWQWRNLCDGARGFDVTGLPPSDWHPMLQPVSDFHFNRRLASLFDARVGQGRLLVCGYDITVERGARLPEVAALRERVLAHAARPDWHPTWSCEPVTLDALFPAPVAALAALPQGFAGADLYVRAAGLLGARSRSMPWRKKDDQVLARAEGVDYHVEKSDGVWRDEHGSAWHGAALRVELRPRAGVPATIHVRLEDWNRNGRTGQLTIEGKTFDIGPHVEGRWFRHSIIREDTNDGKIIVEAHALTGPNLMITDLAVVPDP